MDWEHRLARPLDAAGNSLPIPRFLFDDGTSTIYEGDGHSALRVVANSLDGSYAVSFQRTIQGEFGPARALK